VATSALIVTDMLNPYDHEDADRLADSVQAVVEPLAELIARARDAGVDVIYVNDNYGDFAATRDEIVERALAGRRPSLIEPLVPPGDCPFLHKARHSAFYSTALEYLLQQRDVTRVVLTGQVTEQCILYSALDAYVRHFSVCVPADAVAAIDHELGEAALRMMQRNMRAEIVAAADALAD
jgi:nicotinamidase-related amidase